MQLPLDHPFETGEYVIVTDQMHGFTKKVEFVLQKKIPGMIAYGPGRIGKTTCVQAVEKNVNNNLPGRVRVLKTIIENHKVGEPKKFYMEMCNCFGIDPPRKKKIVSSDVRSVIIEYMINEARANNNQILLIIDEANLLLADDYGYLMDIYNRLEAAQVKLICILVGTEELCTMKESMKRQGKGQVIGRFMIHDYVFSPIANTDDIRDILKSYDSKIKYKGIPLTEEAFPQSFREGKRLENEAETIASIIRRIREDNMKKSKKKKRKDMDYGFKLQQQILIQAIEYVLEECGIYGDLRNQKKWPEESDWEEGLRIAGAEEGIGVLEDCHGC